MYVRKCKQMYIYAFFNLLSNENKSSDINDLWKIFNEQKKKTSKILGCYLALPYGYMFFFSQKYHAAAVCLFWRLEG